MLVVDDPIDGATTSTPGGWAASGRARLAPGTRGPGDEPFVRLSPADLDLDPRVVHELALCREGDDLAACLVPALVSLLLAGARPVVVLSSEVVLLGPLEALADPAATSGVVLVPRLLAPPPTDDRDPTGPAVVAAGAYDPGIIAVGPGADGFLDWWAASLTQLAVSSASMLADRQPFLDFAPESFGALIFRDPGHGVAYWNAHERDLTWSEECGYRADGTPLRLVHLEGFDPATPQLLAPGAGSRPRVLLSEVPALRRLCAARASQLAPSKEHGTG
ncbi:MAG: FkbM family methyltransferase, partial [Acidimicrobiaceae bacterium]|nr:FkbM family methyltransferase [Acidimicrobiaceae bacterium]